MFSVQCSGHITFENCQAKLTPHRYYLTNMSKRKNNKKGQRRVINIV